jgi:hypothetical protein
MAAVLCVLKLSRIRWTSSAAGNRVAGAEGPAEVPRTLPSVKLADDLARLGVERRIERRRPGCMRSRAWICAFSSTHSINALSGGLSYRPTASRPFSMNNDSILIAATPEARQRTTHRSSGLQADNI